MSQVNDSDEIKKIYLFAIEAFKSIVNLLKTEANVENLSHVFESTLPVNFGTWTKFPTIGTLKVSLFNLLRNNELPSLKNLYYTYRYFSHI